MDKDRIVYSKKVAVPRWLRDDSWFVCVVVIALSVCGASPQAFSAPPPLTDEELLDHTEARAAQYFWDQTFSTNGFVRDTTGAAYASIAATGFGLAALVVIAERYHTSGEWTISPGLARLRAEQILSAAVAIQERQAADPSTYGTAGCLYHFIDAEGRRAGTSEVSTTDMALLIAGTLTAGQYFGGQVQSLADRFFRAVQWSYFLDRETGQFYHAWKPERVSGYTVGAPNARGGLSDLHWDRPTDEVLLLALLALASDPFNQMFRESLYRWPRVVRRYKEYGVVSSYFGSLFTYLLGHAFFDFQSMGMDNPGAQGVASVEPVDWFLNARQAILANRQFAIDQATAFPTYSSEQWGLSACYRPDGTYFGANGAEPAENPPLLDGTLPPYTAISAMPLLRISPHESLQDNLAFQALRHYYDRHFDGLWGPYGPRDSFVVAWEGNHLATRYTRLYVGIDVGPEVLMIENYRTALIHRFFMSHPDILAAVRMQFPAHDPRINQFPAVVHWDVHTVPDDK